MGYFILVVGWIALALSVLVFGIAVGHATQSYSPDPATPFVIVGALSSALGAVLILGFGQLILTTQALLGTLKQMDQRLLDGAVPPAKSEPKLARSFSKFPEYVPLNEPAQGGRAITYRGMPGFQLEDGSIALNTTAGWRRFRSLKEFDDAVSES